MALTGVVRAFVQGRAGSLALPLWPQFLLCPGLTSSLQPKGQPPFSGLFSPVSLSLTLSFSPSIHPLGLRGPFLKEKGI